MMKRTTSHEVGVKSGALGPSHSEQVLPTSAQEGLAACWLPARPEEEMDFLLEGWRAPVQPSPLPPPPERPSHLLLAHRPTCVTPRCPGHLSSHCRLLLHTLAPAHAVGISCVTLRWSLPAPLQSHLFCECQITPAPTVISQEGRRPPFLSLTATLCRVSPPDAKKPSLLRVSRVD